MSRRTASRQAKARRRRRKKSSTLIAHRTSLRVPPAGGRGHGAAGPRWFPSEIPNSYDDLGRAEPFDVAQHDGPGGAPRAACRAGPEPPRRRARRPAGPRPARTTAPEATTTRPIPSNRSASGSTPLSLRLSRVAVVRALFIRIRNSQVRRDDRPSNRSTPRTTANQVSCTTSSATASLPTKVRSHTAQRRVVRPNDLGEGVLVAATKPVDHLSLAHRQRRYDEPPEAAGNVLRPAGCGETSGSGPVQQSPMCARAVTAGREVSGSRSSPFGYGAAAPSAAQRLASACASARRAAVGALEGAAERLFGVVADAAGDRGTPRSVVARRSLATWSASR